MKQSVLVGLSGGIDSTMTAFLLKEKGYEVTGVHFKFLNDNCDSDSDKLKRVTEKLGIKLIEHNASDIFKQEVIGYFANFHLEGRTPSPCAHCNPSVKWKLLSDIAKSKNIDKVATGHYIRIFDENNLHRIYRGTDKAKDQSYYMWRLEQNILSQALTPLGEFTKQEVRRLAKKTGFDMLAESGESSGLCFAGGRNYEELINHYIPGLAQKVGPGKVINREGEEIGTHKGYVYYTIGQKKDLDLKVNEKLCVISIDATNNILVADTWQSLYQHEFVMNDFIFADNSELQSIKEIGVMVRGFGLNPAGNAKVEIINDTHIRIYLENAAWALAPGQPAVFYAGDKLLGGGIIC